MRVFTIILTLLFFLGISQNNYSQTIEQNKITVFGKVKTYAKADRAKFSFSINGYGKSLALAFDNAKNQMYELSEKLYAIGLTQENISTSFFTSSKNYGDKAFLSSKKDYLAAMSVSISTEDMDLLEKIIITLSDAKIERINNIVFELKNLKELKEKALVEAIIKAKNKAALISETLEITYSGIIDFHERMPEENMDNYPYRGRLQQQYNSITVMADSDILSNGGSSVFANELSFVTEVMITYGINEK